MMQFIWNILYTYIYLGRFTKSRIKFFSNIHPRSCWNQTKICNCSYQNNNSSSINSDKSKYNNATIIYSTTIILNSICTSITGSSAWLELNRNSIRSFPAYTKWLFSSKQFDFINLVNHTQTIHPQVIPHNIFSFNLNYIIWNSAATTLPVD